MNLFSLLTTFLRNQPDILELFGDTGTGKSTFFLEAVKAAAALGKSCLILDNEKNFDRTLFNSNTHIDYCYLPNFTKFYRFVLSNEFLAQHYDVVMVDSLGLPVLGEFALGTMKERGDTLLKTQAITYQLKKFSEEQNAYVFLTNQPESEFGKTKSRDNLRPFGDKHAFFVKEIWKAYLQLQMPTETKTIIKAWRSRFCGKGTELFQLTITTAGTTITPIYQIEQPKKKKKKKKEGAGKNA